MDFSFAITIFAILISFAGYFLYIKSILAGKTKPHAFSWFVWSVLFGIVFAAQLSENSGFGAYVSGVSMLALLAISLLALKIGKLEFPLADWLCLLGAVASIALWAYLKDPTLSIVLIVIIDFLAFIPTIRKACKKPFEEDYRLFAISSLKFFISLFALNSFTIATALYPMYLTVANCIVAILIVIKRKTTRDQISKAFF